MQQLFLHIAIHSSSACVIYDAIYSKQRLLRLRPLPSNNELSSEKAHWQATSEGNVKLLFVFLPTRCMCACFLYNYRNISICL